MLTTSNPLSSNNLSTSLPTTPTQTGTALTTELNPDLLKSSSSSSVNGLKGEYFQGANFNQLKHTRTDASVNFRWGTQSPTTNVSADYFSVRWTGQVIPTRSETYTFHTNSDDGVRLWVNGQKLIDNWALQQETERQGSLKLEAGKAYDIKMEYFENNGNATSQLLWSSPSQQKQVIPTSQLRSEATTLTTTPQAELQSKAPIIGNGNGLKAEYFAGTDLKNLKLTRTDATVNFKWNFGAPNSAVGQDQFSVRWSGQIMPKYTETYTFQTSSDDGVRLWVNGQKIIDKWTLQSTTENQGKVTLEAGKKYDIRLEYFENTGNATAQLMWSSPTQVKEIVPQSQLFSQSGNNSGELPSPGGSEVPPPPTGGGVVNPTPIDYNEKPSVVVPGAQSTVNTVGLPLLGIKVSDPDAGNSNVTVTIKATDGTLNVKGGINGGVPLSGILNNGTATVVLVGTLLQINTTLANAAGVVYQPKQAFEGPDQITVSVNDNGNTGVGGALTDVQTFSVVVGAAGTSFPNANSPLGNNLTSINYYSREFPFVDIFKMNSGFTPQRIEGGKWTASDLKLRPDGYPTSLEAGQLAEAIVLTTGDFAPNGKYTVFYEGEGEIRVKASGKQFLSTASQPGRMTVDFTDGGMWFQILKTNPNNPIRNVRIVMPGAENTYQKDPFNSVFLDRLSKFKVLRFMDWGETNGSNIKEWSDRTTLTSLSQGTKKGVALEHMIDLSNRLKVDPWLTIPHQASDDYVRQYAKMVRDRLDPNLKVYVEYSNEVWNTIFAQHTYAKDKGLQLKLSNDPFQAAMRYYSQRSVEIFKIFEEVFGGTERLERVLAAQSASTWTQEQVLTWKDAYKNTDNLSTAPYFQGDLNDVNKVDRTLNLTVKQAIDILLEDVRTRKVEQISSSSKLAKQYGLDLVAYEGGQHLVSAYFPQAKQDAVTNFFTEVNRSPLMKDVYMEYLNTWKSNGGGLFVNFSSVTAPSKWGWWGALEYQDQDISTAPKYQALMEFIDKNPTNK